MLQTLADTNHCELQYTADHDSMLASGKTGGQPKQSRAAASCRDRDKPCDIRSSERRILGRVANILKYIHT